MLTVEEVLLDLQEQIYTSKALRTDVYRTEGEGALVVAEGMPVQQGYIILQIPEFALHTGNKLSINF